MNKSTVYSDRGDFRLDWITPDEIFDPLNEIFRFTVDLMADSESSKCDYYIDDILNIDPRDFSRDVCWINPRYGSWLKMVMPIVGELGFTAKNVVALLPASVDLPWFHSNVSHTTHVEPVRVFFRKGRIRFKPTEQIKRFYKKREKETGKKWANAPAHANMLVTYGKVTPPQLNDLGDAGWFQV